MVKKIIHLANLKKIWWGKKLLKKGIYQTFWSVIRFILSGWLWDIALRLVPMPEPYKKAGVLVAFMGLLFFIWGIRGLWSSLQAFGLSGLCFILGSYFLLLFTFNLLTYSKATSIQERLLPSLTESGTQIWKLTNKIIRNMINAPEDFRFAYTGNSAGDYISGFPTPDPNNKIIVEVESTNLGVIRNLSVGGYTSVNTENGNLLDCHSEPDLTFPVSAKFPDKIRLLILEGPMIDKQENTTWWKLHGSQGEGWCNEKFLLPVQ